MRSRRSGAPALRRLVVLAGAFVAAGCAANRGVAELAAAPEHVELLVENQNFKDAVVYAIWDEGPRGRLGMVTGNTTQTFLTPVRGSGEVRIEVDFIAGNRVVTDRMGVYEGDNIQIVIPPHI